MKIFYKNLQYNEKFENISEVRLKFKRFKFFISKKNSKNKN